MTIQLPIDDTLVDAAVRLSGCKTGQDAVEFALREYIRVHEGSSLRGTADDGTSPDVPPQLGEEWRSRLLNLVGTDEFEEGLLQALGIDVSAGVDETVERRLGLISLFGTIDYDPDYDYKAMRYYKAQSYI